MQQAFTTYEKVETIPLIVIKKTTTASSMTVLSWKAEYSGRAINVRVAAADIQATIDSIETAIFSREEKEIPSSQIGEIVRKA